MFPLTNNEAYIKSTGTRSTLGEMFDGVDSKIQALTNELAPTVLLSTSTTITGGSKELEIPNLQSYRRITFFGYFSSNVGGNRFCITADLYSVLQNNATCCIALLGVNSVEVPIRLDLYPTGNNVLNIAFRGINGAGLTETAVITNIIGYKH